jgi:hypothetical protein
MAQARDLHLTDPRHVPLDHPGPVARLGLALINDERDLPFLSLMASFSLVVFPFAAYLFWARDFPLWLGVVYEAVLFGLFFDRCILMLHCTSHRVLFKPAYRLLNHYIPWVMCPFYGQPPEGYFGHHMGMHHPENNLETDLSTTMPYQRDRFTHFLHYWAVFMTTTLVRLTLYLARHGRKKLALNAVVGELGFYGVSAVGLWLAPKPTLAVFVVPFLFARFLMMWGNWGQHAFIDPKAPGDGILNSITCVNVRYNRRCFNDGYHIGHHVKASRHWTDLPDDLLRSRATYAERGAVVFEGIDFFQVSLYLFLKRYDWLADHFVELRDEPRTRDEIIAFLRSRTLPVVRERDATDDGVAEAS